MVQRSNKKFDGHLRSFSGHLHPFSGHLHSFNEPRRWFNGQTEPAMVIYTRSMVKQNVQRSNITCNGHLQSFSGHLHSFNAYLHSFKGPLHSFNDFRKNSEVNYHRATLIYILSKVGYIHSMTSARIQQSFTSVQRPCKFVQRSITFIQ
jgi:hypothetical protein